MVLVVRPIHWRMHRCDYGRLHRPRLCDLAPTDAQMLTLPTPERGAIRIVQRRSVGEEWPPALILKEQRSQTEPKGGTADVRGRVLAEALTQIARRSRPIRCNPDVKQPVGLGRVGRRRDIGRCRVPIAPPSVETRCRWRFRSRLFYGVKRKPQQPGNDPIKLN